MQTHSNSDTTLDLIEPHYAWYMETVEILLAEHMPELPTEIRRGRSTRLTPDLEATVDYLFETGEAPPSEDAGTDRMIDGEMLRVAIDAAVPVAGAMMSGAAAALVEAPKIIIELFGMLKACIELRAAHLKLKAEQLGASASADAPSASTAVQVDAANQEDVPEQVQVSLADVSVKLDALAHSAEQRLIAEGLSPEKAAAIAHEFRSRLIAAL